MSRALIVNSLLILFRVDSHWNLLVGVMVGYHHHKVFKEISSAQWALMGVWDPVAKKKKMIIS